MIRAAARLAPLLRLVGVGACALALSGCVTLLPKSKPAQLYRFGQPPAAAEPAAVGTVGTVGVYRANGTFQGEAAGDRMLTISGGKAAFIARSRWVAPAGVLFNQAVLAAFDADPGPVRIISRGEPGKSQFSLRLDVRNFEARYDAGSHAAPTVVVRVRAALAASDLSKTSERIFEARAKASDNRVGAIVAAYDEAVGEVLSDLVAWTNDNASADRPDLPTAAASR